MKRELLNVNFVLLLQKREPDKSKLIDLLMDILCIEKDSAYRRLRGEVPFSFAEAITIGERLGISLDGLMGALYEKTKNFALQQSDFEHPTGADRAMWENYNRVLSFFNASGSLSVLETWTTLPFPICYQFSVLAKYCIYEWSFRVYNHIPFKRFEEFVLDDEVLNFGRVTHQERVKATESLFVFSNSFIEVFMEDVLFFKNTCFLSEESYQRILGELEKFVDYLEVICEHGAFPETGHRVSVYIAQISIKNDITLYEASDNYISLIRTQVLNSAGSTDKDCFMDMKTWFDSLRRLSVCISNSGQSERVAFFERQRDLIAAGTDL